MDGIALGQDGKPKLCVGQLPGRKRPSLYFWDPMDIRVLATFRGEDQAADVVRFFEGMIGAKVVLDAKADPDA